ncbi:glycolipid transfer protein [Pectinophora gossypiella]|uniref:Glycolipid transfer protein domain-containing protein n=1 Tax=Pectinophora gossypiella TaxID=13191 RepID=A0A1E1W7I8_PECGO|nr:glycolipid transfer protein [Pectinophora gossypiella]
MASASNSQLESQKFYQIIKHFPLVIDGKINIKGFLEAASDLILLVERLGKVFAPVKYDMQGNIDKIKKYYVYDDNSCLLELMLNDKTKDRPGIESVVWLNRAIHFYELIFEEVINCVQSNQLDVATKKLFTVAYEGSVKKYHNWVTQQIFTFICKMAPTLRQMLKAIEAEGDLKIFTETLTTYNIKLHLIRCKIDDFVKENSLFDETL